MIMNRTILARVTGIYAVVVGVFLLLGAWGHLAAVWPTSLKILMPGLFLAAAGVLNLALCRGLWCAQPRALRWAAIGTGLAFLWLLSLFIGGVPGHPISTFTVIVGLYLALVLLGLYCLPREATPSTA